MPQKVHKKISLLKNEKYIIIKKHDFKISNSLFSEILKTSRMIDMQIGENFLMLDDYSVFRFTAVVGDAKPSFYNPMMSIVKPPFFVILNEGKKLQVKRDFFQFLISNNRF